MVIHNPFIRLTLQRSSDRIKRWAWSWLPAALWVLFAIFPMISTYAEVDSEPVSVAIVFSLAHQQYLEAVEGLSRVLEAESVDLEVFTLEDYHGKRRSVLKEKMTEPSFGFYVGVGRKAARFIWDELDFQKTKSLYSVVQDPEKILPLTKDACGISLNIPISTQVEKISAGLPGAKRIGLLFDPRNNDPFFIQAQKIAEDFGLRIVPLRVSSSEEIPAVLKTHLKDVDALWLITDSTGTPSESIIQFIIETALLNRVPVIGYNSFYHESGAALSFIFDYQELGVQTGELIMELLNTGVCSSPDPKFSLWVNRKTSQRLGIPLGEEAVTEDGATP